MRIFPAIDLIDGKAVRLYKGDYNQKTVYSDSPADVAVSFATAGAKYLHLVDLDGAKSGVPENLDVIKEIVSASKLITEVGGGIRSADTIEKYLNIGVDRVILGTAALENQDLLKSLVAEYGRHIVVGVDARDGFVAVKGWLEVSNTNCFDFMDTLEQIGVKNIICTDISKDGAMSGTNRGLYKQMCERYSMNITASGGVSSMDDVTALSQMGLYGAIIGKALYTKDIDLKEAVLAAGEQE